MWTARLHVRASRESSPFSNRVKIEFFHVPNLACCDHCQCMEFLLQNKGLESILEKKISRRHFLLCRSNSTEIDSTQFQILKIFARSRSGWIVNRQSILFNFSGKLTQDTCRQIISYYSNSAKLLYFKLPEIVEPVQTTRSLILYSTFSLTTSPSGLPPL